MSKVSVIVPIYDVEDYIDQCLSTISDQTYSDIEIICINDATLDNSIGIVKQHMRWDSRIRLLNHDTNRGLGATRNTGLRHAASPYIRFVDGDDAIVPESVEVLLATLERTGADWVFTDFHVMDEHGGVRSRSPFHVADVEERARSGLLDLNFDKTALNGMWPSAWIGLWRADHIRSVSARFPEGLHFEDHEFFFRYGFSSRTMAYLNRPLYIYRASRPGQITRDTSDRIFDIFVVLERLFSEFALHLQGEALLRFSARSAVRLIVERTWAMATESDLITAYRKKAAGFLSRFPRDLLFSCKDWYISDEVLNTVLLDDTETDFIASNELQRCQ